MLKKRLIACLLIKDNLIVQSVGFNNYYPIGNPSFSIEFISRWDVDEIILLDITPKSERVKRDYTQLKLFIKKCFIPITFGGGISCIEDVNEIIKSGADRISINSNAINSPVLVEQIARIYGEQCIVTSIDYKIEKNGDKTVYSNSGTKNTGLSLLDWAKKCESLGSGEILLNSIDRDGKGQGYDIDTIKEVSSSVNIPVIACGGVGKFSDFSEAILKGGASAAAAANIFHYVEHSTIIAKANMLKSGVNIRLNKIAQYSDRKFDKNGRLIMLDNDQLEKADWAIRDKNAILY
ncbi:MAG: Imidazole glycerol phosphate synthase subunit HisF [Alphaproteobacteria bacterium MarineAlpha9_Bin3]|nr:MAG: Imidazole glycerol phosphate synthase subunit HisF [Alphaproteobacteria bacterium MarineAlpha9_Bin3]|tara:strand:+ start:4983 stop:5861 length:879 start_codon:yes stop_codon:yes gene_type:complete